MDKIAKYKIVMADGTLQLEGLVAEEIKKGWQPLGGPFPVVFPRHNASAIVTFYQAVTMAG
jgi:hypothetical protein